MAHAPIPELDRTGLRKFGITTGIIVAVLFGALLPWLFGFAFPYWPFILAGVLVLWGLVHPGSLKPVYKGWMTFGLMISKVTTPLVLGLVFYVVILPIGWVMRLFRDPMARKFDEQATTYRVVQDTPNSMEQPF